MDFKIGRTRYTISFGFFAVLAVYMLCDREGFGLPALCAIVLHEMGHVAAIHGAGVRIDALQLQPFGVRLEKSGFPNYGQEAVIYLGGVAANAFAAALSYLFTGLGTFTLVNLALIFFNLLPVGRLDGGMLLKLGLCRFGRFERAELVQKLIGFLLLTPLFAAAFYLLPKGNYTLFFTAVYLAFTLFYS